ncbi:unnamed protein product (macronuclear) [Paramecium tetraurelia]|uniref:Uncharacterized protein n=1 Tax=Paramecium tetraurelia TaxID=5888 RepID=A0DXF5_PARTE|nr:uncharacterized protein GSPATT00021355001 [Paramecium tetraurelia]CAK87722.1 unnamed protein product [Paramecium tetraurelia]|eukprot:XP_001455119.1 hypothetical protein (macronuclear) [Paramecium tetraurelia strain d4-2]
MIQEDDCSPNFLGQIHNFKQQKQHPLEDKQIENGPCIFDIEDEQNEFQQFENKNQEIIQSSKQSQDDIDCEQPDLKSTKRMSSKIDKMKHKNKNKSNRDYQVIEEGVDEQQKTKNLNNYYIRHIVKEIRTILQNEETEANLMQLLDGKYNCTQLGKILDEELYRQIAISYILSFNFFNDLLSSKKLKDVEPIIKYARQLEKISFKNEILYFKD